MSVRASFPKYVHVTTIHGLAHKYVGHKYGERFNARITSSILINTLSLNKDEFDLSPTMLSYLVLKTFRNFCNSNSDFIGPEHIEQTKPSTKGYSQGVF